MKIRLGFVPNSSSSSFIVSVIDHFMLLDKGKKPKRYISKEKQNLIRKFGFIKTQIGRPEVFSASSKEKRTQICKDWPVLYYGYDVTCNQDDVIEFLIKHRIPFQADIHYGDYTYFYDGGDYVFVLPNYGRIFHRDKNESFFSAIGKMILNDKIECLPIYSFMSKKDKDAYINKLRKIPKKKEYQ